MAWAVALIAMPVVALPAFLVFGGRMFRGYVSKRRSSDARLNEEWKEFQAFYSKARCFDKGTSHDIDAFEALAGSPFVCAKKIEILRDGEEFFPAIEKAIAGAREFVEFQFYVLRDDEIGKRLGAILARKATEGVSVRVLYDPVGSSGTKADYFDGLRKAGVKVAAFASGRWRWQRPRFQVNFRNHRKLVNVDNEHVFLGGLNVGDDYLSRYPEIGRWRDTAIHIEGAPAVQAQHSFAADWYWSTGEVIDFDAKRTPKAIDGGGIPVLVMATSPTASRETASLALLNAIETARRRLWLTTPYLVPDETIVTALQLAVIRGVEVRLLVTDKTDMLLPQLASYTFYDELIPYGVQIHRYRERNGLMHQKVVLVDDELAYVGSANLDNRSLRLNFEIGAWVRDRDVAMKIRDLLEADFARSDRLDVGSVDRMPAPRRFASGLARLMAPAL